MMIRAVILTFAAAAALGAEPSVDESTAPAAAEPAEAPAEPSVKELDAERLQIGEVIFNRKTREIRFPAQVNLAGDELLEFAVVHSKGKVHESLLATDIPATHLNVAFKLLRYPASAEFYAITNEDGTISQRFPEVAADVKTASRIDISVEWQDDGKSRTARINEWIAHGSLGQSMPADPWVYGGSGIHAGKFIADTTGDYIAIYLSNSALINFSGKDNDSDEVWAPFPKRVPPVGTPVTVILSPHSHTDPAEKP